MQELGRLLRCCKANARCISQEVLMRSNDILQAASTSNGLRAITLESVTTLLKGTASGICSCWRWKVLLRI